MPNYAAVLKRTASTSQSVGNITAPGSGMRRAWITFLQFGCEGAAADNAFDWLVQRCTTAGTRTSVTPELLDNADAAAVTTAGKNHSGEPTYTSGAIPIDTPVNQRATYQWYAPPGGELVIPATANNGYGIQTPTAAALAVTATAHWRE